MYVKYGNEVMPLADLITRRVEMHEGALSSSDTFDLNTKLETTRGTYAALVSLLCQKGVIRLVEVEELLDMPTGSLSEARTSVETP